jgi:hypothetical protein
LSNGTPLSLPDWLSFHKRLSTHTAEPQRASSTRRETLLLFSTAAPRPRNATLTRSDIFTDGELRSRAHDEGPWLGLGYDNDNETSSILACMGLGSPWRRRCFCNSILFKWGRLRGQTAASDYGMETAAAGLDRRALDGDNYYPSIRVVFT